MHSRDVSSHNNSMCFVCVPCVRVYACVHVYVCALCECVHVSVRECMRVGMCAYVRVSVHLCARGCACGWCVCARECVMIF